MRVDRRLQEEKRDGGQVSGGNMIEAYHTSMRMP